MDVPEVPEMETESTLKIGGKGVRGGWANLNSPISGFPA
jgi:hypothetical protein